MTLSELKQEFSKYQVLADNFAIDIILATMIGNMLMGRDPIWTMLVAPASAGKSTLIAPCSAFGFCKFIDDLTEKTLLSGFASKGRNMSLLTAMTTAGQKMLVFSDFTSILSKNPIQSNEILGQMRRLYDGRLEKATGTGEVKFHGRMGMLAACTPSIYRFLESGKASGERFVYYWMIGASPEEIRRKKSENLLERLSAKEIENAMSPIYAKYYKGVEEYVKRVGLPKFVLTEEQNKRVYDASNFAVLGKAHIDVDWKSKKATDMPEVAGIGRDLETYLCLLQTLQLMDSYELGREMPVSEDRIELVERCAYSSIHRTRRRILEILTKTNERQNPTRIGATKGFGLEAESVKLYLYPLHAVQLVQKDDTNKSDHTYYVREGANREFIKRISAKMQEPHIENFDDTNETGDEPSYQTESWEARRQAEINDF